MELILNLAWAAFATGLIWFWVRGLRSNPAPRRTQVLALMIVVLLLLPVISLSDDLLAAQGPAEADCCLRRALDSSHSQHTIVPASFALPEEIITDLWIGSYSLDALQSDIRTVPLAVLTPPLNRRPPPQV
jgi:hypothetical protein